MDRFQIWGAGNHKCDKGRSRAENLPDIFSSYADTAYAVQQEGKLADLSEYFTEEEKSSM